MQRAVFAIDYFEIKWYNCESLLKGKGFMAITTILFDLDGTLLPMDQDAFVKGYYTELAKKASGFGYEPAEFVNAVKQGTYAMLKNSSDKTNEQVFWERFAQIYGEKGLKDKPMFDDFYLNEFLKTKEFCGYNPESQKLIKRLKEMGLRVALATNPLFPSIATEHRIAWAGLEKGDFEIVTTYENSKSCKPQLKYYSEVMNALGVTAKECVMVGNDTSDDMVARELGIKVFLLTEHLINEKGLDINEFPNGSFEDLVEFIKGLLCAI